MISANKRRKQAEEAARRFRRQDLSNRFKGQRVSTIGADLQSEQASRNFASGAEALTASGVRGVVGGIGALTGAANDTNRQIGAGLDQQRVRLDQLIAQDDIRIQGMQEQRDNQELAAIQGMTNAANQDFYSGLGGIAQSAFSAGSLSTGGPEDMYNQEQQKLARQANREQRKLARQTRRNQ